MIIVQAVGFDKLQAGLLNARAYLATDKTQTLIDLADELGDLVKKELNTSDFIWKGTLADSISTEVISSNEVAVTEFRPNDSGSDVGLFILYGTEGTQSEWKGPPGELLDWTTDKLGLDGADAWVVAMTILRQGIVAHRHYPGGGTGYNYAMRVVEETGKNTIQDYAEKIGDIAVRYIDAGV